MGNIIFKLLRKFVDSFIDIVAINLKIVGKKGLDSSNYSQNMADCLKEAIICYTQCFNYTLKTIFPFLKREIMIQNNLKVDVIRLLLVFSSILYSIYISFAPIKSKKSFFARIPIYMLFSYFFIVCHIDFSIANQRLTNNNEIVFFRKLVCLLLFSTFSIIFSDITEYTTLFCIFLYSGIQNFDREADSFGFLLLFYIFTGIFLSNYYFKVFSKTLKKVFYSLLGSLSLVGHYILLETEFKQLNNKNIFEKTIDGLSNAFYSFINEFKGKNGVSGNNLSNGKIPDQLKDFDYIFKIAFSILKSKFLYIFLIIFIIALHCQEKDERFKKVLNMYG